MTVEDQQTSTVDCTDVNGTEHMHLAVTTLNVTKFPGAVPLRDCVSPEAVLIAERGRGGETDRARPARADLI